MDQLKAYVKFISILVDMAFPQTAYVQSKTFVWILNQAYYCYGGKK